MEEEIKVSPKFEIVFLSEHLPLDPRLEKLKHWCDEFFRAGLMPKYAGGAYGNLSFRLNDGENKFIITASGMKDTTDRDSLVMVEDIDFAKTTVHCRGRRSPSSESMLHFLIYQNRKDVGAIFHGHSPEILAKAETLNLPCTLKEEPYGTLALAKQALAVLTGHDFIVLKNHGFVAVGNSMEAAGESALKVLVLPK